MNDASRHNEWGLFKGLDSGFMQVWAPEVTDRLTASTSLPKTRLEFVTRGDRETLEALLTLNNAQIRAQQGESDE